MLTFIPTEKQELDPFPVTFEEWRSDFDRLIRLGILPEHSESEKLELWHELTREPVGAFPYDDFNDLPF